jgi:hypothetical protein
MKGRMRERGWHVESLICSLSSPLRGASPAGRSVVKLETGLGGGANMQFVSTVVWFLRSSSVCGRAITRIAPTVWWGGGVVFVVGLGEHGGSPLRFLAGFRPSTFDLRRAVLMLTSPRVLPHQGDSSLAARPINSRVSARAACRRLGNQCA